MAKIRIGLAGCGFVSELHMHAYQRVYGLDVEVRAVAARGDAVLEFARRFGTQTTHRDYRKRLEARAIDVIDLCPPRQIQAEMVKACMQAGKHVICEKPFTGYFGRQ